MRQHIYRRRWPEVYQRVAAMNLRAEQRYKSSRDAAGDGVGRTSAFQSGTNT